MFKHTIKFNAKYKGEILTRSFERTLRSPSRKMSFDEAESRILKGMASDMPESLTIEKIELDEREITFGTVNLDTGSNYYQNPNNSIIVYED